MNQKSHPPVVVTILGVLLFGLVPASERAEAGVRKGTAVYRQLNRRDEYDTLVTAINLAGLRRKLARPRVRLTFFAPNNEAFAAFPEPVLGALLADPNQLAELLNYHQLRRPFFTGRLRSRGYRTREGSRLTVERRSGVIEVNDATVVKRNLRANVAVSRGGRGRPNAFIHEIDGVIGPNFAPGDTIADLAAALSAGNPPELTTLLALAGQFDLVPFLSQTVVDITVFAPTDQAFATFLNNNPAATDDQVLSILLDHIVLGEIRSSDLSNGQRLQAISGNFLDVSTNGGVVVEGATVSLADQGAINGVVHLIESVIEVNP
ncbi:MAG: fasciclin domain-containing protein [Verrucomicrobiota bacterium]